MEIESMVANSALIKAREGGGSKGRSWKWREMFRFSHISQCADLAETIERDYYSLCVKQPIGKKLFQLFCRSRPDLQNYISLQDALVLLLKKLPSPVTVVTSMFFQSIQCVSIMLKHEDSCIQRLELDPCLDVFHEYVFFKNENNNLSFSSRQPITKQTFRQYRLLGKGGFGEVWACQMRATGMMYACKKLEKTHVKKRKGEAMALNEKEILEGLDSRFVPGLDKDRVRFYAAEICCGLIHLHQKSILYRSVCFCFSNALNQGHIRISDLGLAVRLSEGKLVRGMVGTLGYMAPEVIGRKHYGMSVDWWGLGCLIYEMTAGQPPYRVKGEHPKAPEMERRIQTEQLEYSDKFSKSAKDICSSLLNTDPKQRLGCQSSGGSEVQAHRFFRKINFRMLEAGLVKPPFKPDPRLVYCSDVQDIDEFSSVKGVILDKTDINFYSKFNTGRVPITWQNEVIETGCFKELNTFGPEGSRSPDLDWSQNPDSPKRSLLDRIFRKKVRTVHCSVIIYFSNSSNTTL
uniref:G protein-coupled receptor kinase 5 n=1 Tax=Sander lucioperca TaxID=283035 RepID=A0A8C9ZMR0_SANLU